MPNKKILFRFGSKNQPITRFGEIDILSRACYFRGIELGYKQGDIFFEWPLNIQYLLVCPQNTILPIKFINSNDINLSEYHRIINLTDSDIFYKDSSPLFNEKSVIERNHGAFLNYLNKYYMEYKKRPVYHIKMDKIKEKYILVHTRKLEYSTTRNSNINNYEFILKLLKERYNDYEIYRCGERDIHEKKFNKLFDRYFNHFLDFNSFLKLMNNSSLFVGCSSGPIQYAYSFEKPIIEINIPKTINWSPIQDRYVGMGNYFSKKFWKDGLNGKYGDTIDYYINKETYLKLFTGDKINKKKILEFMDKWLM
ncbi:MAG: hypothetical protein IMZ52_07935 [Actinobacteria bacterium]|nr:hypothetical protein [Actinomycetota bacterium]MBE3114656.1 hypothetical protein [Actinomycetota bacterium]